MARPVSLASRSFRSALAFASFAVASATIPQASTAVAAAIVAPARTAAVPSPETLFKLAQGAWQARSDPPFVTYSLRERYVWRDRTHDNWWQGRFRGSDRALALERMVVAADESSRLRGFPIRLNLRYHHSDARADSLDTNAGADAFPLFDPLIDPDDSFGLDPLRPSVHPSSSAGDSQASAASPLPAMLPRDGALHELARVGASARDYSIAYAGLDPVGGVPAYHLVLKPLRAPAVNRLRELWIDPATFATERLVVQGLFTGKPYDGARWTVTYFSVDGRPYVSQIDTSDVLHFGVDRNVSELSFAFVNYAFPATIPDLSFRRLL